MCWEQFYRADMYSMKDVSKFGCSVEKTNFAHFAEEI